MKEEGPAWAAATLVTAVGLFVLLGFISVTSYAVSSFGVHVSLPMLVVAAAVALLASIAFTVVTLSFFGLYDKQQALGLPDGSVRAIIALLLIVIFAILAVHFFGQIKNEDRAKIDFAKQMTTILGTLVTAITSFYFGTRAADASASGASPGDPSITDIDPTEGTAGSSVTLTINGTNLLLVQGVTLTKGARTIPGAGVLSSASQVTCTVAIPTDAEKVAWDVVLATSDSKRATLPASFTVK